MQCRGCTAELVELEDLITACVECGEVFCIDCDEFVHTVLHHCPGCQAKVKKKAEEEVKEAKEEEDVVMQQHTPAIIST